MRHLGQGCFGVASDLASGSGFDGVVWRCDGGEGLGGCV